MNDKDLEAFEKWIDSDVLSQDESTLFKNMSEQERVVFVTERTWKAACEYKDMQLINGSKMKQMNDRIEELIDENKKLRKIIHDLVITGMDIDMAERLEEIDEE